MNGHDDLGQLLRRHYLGTADEHPADGQLDAVLERTRVMRPRPAWLVGLRGPIVRVVGRPGAPRRVWVAVAILLAIATFVAALAGGMFRSDKPLGRSGTIAYSVLDDPTSETGHVRLVDADGTHDRDVGPGLCPTFSRDGSAVAYRTGSQDRYEVTVVASDGSSPRVVPEVSGSEYALSPDGTRVAWLRALDLIETPTADGASLGYSRIELWVTPVAGGPGRRIVPDPADPTEFFQSIAWSPDGRRIAFATMKTLISGDSVAIYRSAIHVVDADGSDLSILTARPGTYSVGLSWSPDGSHLAYLGLPDGSPLPSLGPGGGAQPTLGQPDDVFVVKADGTGDRNLTQTATYEREPEWSPDGSHIAYLTSQESNYRLATIRMLGSGAAEAPSLGPAADVFAWSPSGDEILALMVSRRAANSRPDGPDPASWGTFTLVDAEFRQDPVTLLVVDNAIECRPSWQRVAP